MSNVAGTTTIGADSWAIRMTGSMGSYAIKFDKTLSHSLYSYILLAKTRGLVVATQRIDFSICGTRGSSTITPPAESLYQIVDRGASGDNANANFAEW